MKERHALSEALDQLDSRGTPGFGPERVELEDDVLVQCLGEHLEPRPAAEIVPNLVIVIVIPDDDAPDRARFATAFSSMAASSMSPRVVQRAASIRGSMSVPTPSSAAARTAAHASPSTRLACALSGRSPVAANADRYSSR
jgi:hypothetical protein